MKRAPGQSVIGPGYRDAVSATCFALTWMTRMVAGKKVKQKNVRRRLSEFNEGKARNEESRRLGGKG